MKKIKAFTLAETLITLLVIGVVATLTIPALMQQIGDYTLQKQKDVFSKKWAEGLRQMRVDEKLSEKYTTEEFVNEMKKYFKIAQVCDKNNLTSCFSENFVYKGDADYVIKNGNTNYKSTESVNKSFITSNLKTTQAIKTATGQNSPGYTADVMGIVFSDGVQMLITVNPDCTGIESGDTTGNLYQCFGYIADVNSVKTPNNITKDIVTNIQMADLGFEVMALARPHNSACPSADYNGTGDSSFCYLPSALETNDVIAKYSLGKKSKGNDMWGGAMKYCIDKGYKLPSPEQLTKMAKAMGYNESNCTVEEQYNQPYYKNCATSNIDTTMLNNIKSVLTSAPNSNVNNIYTRYFGADHSWYGQSQYGRTGTSSSYLAICVK